jgi:hypothetical protein
MANTEMDRLIELARDPAAFWEASPPPEIFGYPESTYFLSADPAMREDERVSLALKLLRERTDRRQQPF